MSPVTRPITVTLPLNYWRLAQKLIKSAYLQQGRDVISQGVEIYMTIEAAIFNRKPTPLKYADLGRVWIFDQSKNRAIIEEPAEEYGTRELQGDLGMNFMSEEQFNDWLDDQGQ